MQLVKDLWNVVLALLAVVKTLVSYVKLAIHSVANLIAKFTAKKAPAEQAPTDQPPTV